jgi:hypothetical protein
MRYRFTARAALLGALALALTPAMVAGPAQAGYPAPRLAQQRGATAGPAPGPAPAAAVGPAPAAAARTAPRAAAKPAPRSAARPAATSAARPGSRSTARAAFRAAARPALLPTTMISRSCRGQSTSPQEAADSTGHHVYVVWEGCRGIGFARSASGGTGFRRPVRLPGSAGGFDPAVAVAPNGTVYAVFMKQTAHHQFPVVVASFDHGRSFPQLARLIQLQLDNFGGRPFIAAGTDGAVYLTWNYGPSAAEVSYICTKHGGGCGFKAGDLNIVLQKSIDFGLHWGPMLAMSPGFPASGADSAPLLVEPNGTIDMEYQDFSVTNAATLTLGPAHNYFTSSADGGATWSAPVRVGPKWASMAPREWWIDGSVARDTGGNLYVTWDSQRKGHDVSWLSFSADGGTSWSSPVRVTSDRDNDPHIVEVVGGFRGTAYVAWLSDSLACGYRLRVRTFSLFSGQLSSPVRTSARCGRRHVWPGGIFGIAALPPQDLANGTWQLALSWGSAVAHRHRPPSQILSTVLSYPGAG